MSLWDCRIAIYFVTVNREGTPTARGVTVLHVMGPGPTMGALSLLASVLAIVLHAMGP